VRWDPVLGASRYRVYRDGVLRSKRVRAIAYVDSKLSARSTHTYAVAACDPAGCSSRSTAAPAGPLGPCDGPTVEEGPDIQAVLDANPEGTTLCFLPGTYALSAPLAPR